MPWPGDAAEHRHHDHPQGQRHRGHRGRPPWWPEGETWPPRGRGPWQRHAARRMMRRAGCALLLLLLLLGATGTAAVWLVASALGIVSSGVFARAVSAAALLLGAVAVVGVGLLARRLAAPADRLVDAAARIEAGDYGARVPVRGPAEMRSVARAFNAMSERLEAAAAQRRSAMADLAHELRTPLAIIRGQAEGISDGVYAGDPERMTPILAATRTMEALVDDLGTLALAEQGGLRLAREPVDVAMLVAGTLAAFAGQAESAGVTLVDAVPAELPAVDADPVRLRRVLGNLVSNALAHGHAGGRVSVEAVPDPAGVRISVVDDGEGIPAELLPRIFDRFVKGPGSRGSGLGLAIVRDVVEAHGGSVEARCTVGEGTRISVVLPAASAATPSPGRAGRYGERPQAATQGGQVDTVETSGDGRQPEADGR